MCAVEILEDENFIKALVIRQEMLILAIVTAAAGGHLKPF